MARRYSDEFKKNALVYVEEHPDLDMRVCADYLGMPYDTLYGWYKRARREKRQGSFDSRNAPLTEEEKEILSLIADKKCIVLLNKIDLCETPDTSVLEELTGQKVLCISAKALATDSRMGQGLTPHRRKSCISNTHIKPLG